jgi:hypothetical protein
MSETVVVKENELNLPLITKYMCLLKIAQIFRK